VHEHALFPLTTVLCIQSHTGERENACFGTNRNWKYILKMLFHQRAIFFLIGDRVSLCGPGWPGTHYVAQAGLAIMIFLRLQHTRGVHHHTWLILDCLN
jgi:hypothetical protein